MAVKHPISNQEVARQIRYVAAVYVVEGADQFRIRAYEAAANIIEQLGSPLYELWEAGQLDEIPGLGEKMRGYIAELFTTGKVAHFEKELKRAPTGMYPLVDLPGVGPKTAAKFAKAFKLTNEKTALETLKKKAESGEISAMPGFTKITEKKILDALTKKRVEPDKRMLLYKAISIADGLINYLKQSPLVKEAEVLGSVRRRLPTVGDIDLAVATNEVEKVIEYLGKYKYIAKVIASGNKLVSIQHATGLRIDIKIHDPKQWGSLLQHYTGSKLHNIHLRNIAKEKKVSLSEYGIKKGTELETFASEVAFYKALGMQYIPPELREDTGEIELAQKDELPKLIELPNIKGDFHIHTSLPFPTSHDMGDSSIAEILDKAEALGYTYIGLSDHNPKQAGLTPPHRFKAVKKRNEHIDKAVTKFFKSRTPTIQVFKGLEVDILPSGELALGDDALELLDYAIVSIHSQFNQDREITTKRILSALAHPKVKILGHPTGRLIGKRQGVDADWEEIFEYCAKNGKLVEINSSPDRLDLPYDLIRLASEKGVKFVINTDTHDTDHMDFMKMGVWMARRGWLTRKDVMNAQPNSGWLVGK